MYLSVYLPYMIYHLLLSVIYYQSPIGSVAFENTNGLEKLRKS